MHGRRGALACNCDLVASPHHARRAPADAQSIAATSKYSCRGGGEIGRASEQGRCADGHTPPHKHSPSAVGAHGPHRG
eukprot:6709672-Prymnesium_polylepis.1